jgi:hypothetical protein
MRENGNMPNGTLTRRPLGLRLSAAAPIDGIQIPRAAVAANRKSGIRINPKSPKINTIQISNRKYSPLLRSPRRIAVFDLRFFRLLPFLIYGSAIKTPRNILKICHIRISNRR